MPLSFSQLLTLAVQIQEEVQDAANTADRVGGFLVELAKSATMPYDPTAEYAGGQYAFFSDAVYRALEAVEIGESPSLAPTKWRLMTGRDTLDTVAKRGGEGIAGKTGQLLELLGGLILGGLETTTNENFPTVVMDPVTRKLMLRGGVAVVEPEAIIVIEEQYEEVATTGVGIYRFTDAAHNTTLTVGEGASLQVLIEEQQNDGSWKVIAVGRTLAMISPPTGATFSSTGLLNIAANSISSNTTMGIRATLALTGSPTVDGSVLITNVAASDSVDVEAPSDEWLAPPAIDVTVISAGGSNYTVDFTLRCPSDWQWRFNSFPTWNDLSELSGGYDSKGYLYGTAIGPIANGASVVLHMKDSDDNEFDLTVTVSGASARHTIYPAP